MKPRLPMLLFAGVAFAWLPYLVLRFYWQHLLVAVPDAAHGEFSGPALYFLPRLLIAAILVSIGLAVAFLSIHLRSTQTPNGRNV
jgi:hypothetical protein